MGPIGAKICIVGEAPFTEEVNTKKPFVGPSGKFLTNLLIQAGINRNDCWITNACKYFVPSSPEGKLIPFEIRARNIGIDLEEQQNELLTEISSLSPNIIIALGQTALKMLTGKKPINKWRGSIINAFGFKCIPTYHPAHILHQSGEVKGYWNKAIVIKDLKKALVNSYDKEWNLPRRNLHVAKSIYDFYEFIERNKQNSKPAIDIEAYKCIPCCVGISFNPNEGITIPLWNSFNLSGLSDSDINTLWILLANFLAEHSVVGQNFGYDRDKLRRLGFTIKSLADDTMLKAFCVHPELPKNLAFLTSIYTNEPYYKDEGMYEGKVEDLLIGCARDACVTKEISLFLDKELDKLGTGDFYRNFILQLHEMYFYNEQLDAIEQNGFRVDESIRLELIKKYVEQDETIRHKLWQLTGDYVNVNSNPKISWLLYEKLKLPLRKGAGEEVITGLLNNVVKDPVRAEILNLILEGRRVRKTLSTYLYTPCDYDGRMRSTYYICLETGRSATGQQEPPIRPIVEWNGYNDEGKKEKKKQARGMAFQTITKHGDIGADVRKMLVVDPGHVFIQADSSQAEARVIFKLANDEQALQDIDTHDYHALTASWFFGGCEDDYSKKKLGYESPIRFAGKTLRHAGHLGASKKRAAIEVNTQARKYKIPFKISEQQAERALRIFHEKQPSIRKVFHAGIIECLERNRQLSAPVPYGIDAKIGGVRTFFERWGDELFRQAFSYIPQRTVSENTKAAGIRIRKLAPYARIIVESHDALLFQIPINLKNEFAEIVKQEFERPINFESCSLPRGELIIPCEIEEGYNYLEMTKFKHMVLV